MAKSEGETHFATKRRGQSFTYTPKQSQNPRPARNIFLENHPVNQLTRIAFFSTCNRFHKGSFNLRITLSTRHVAPF